MILATIINFLHFCFVLFVVITPFFQNANLLFLHILIVPFMIAHWITNNNSCSLTLIERKLSNSENDDDCFTCKLIEPVYDFKKNNVDKSDVIYFVTVVLWIISLIQFYFLFTS